MPSHQLEQTAGFLITGRVQRVGFRWWARRTATRLGLSGTVSNLVDGTVEVHVRGTGDVIDQFRERLQVGPPMAVVETVEVIPSVDSFPTGFHLLP